MFTTHIDSYPTITETLPERGRDAVERTLDRLDERLEELGDEFIVIGGANMVLRGIKRVTTDIDVLVSDRAFERMGDFEGAAMKKPPARALDQGATNVSIWINTEWTDLPISAAREMGDGYYPMSYEDYADQPDLEVIEGFAVVPIEHVWESKVALQRPKDILDLHDIARKTGRDTNFPPPLYTGPHTDS